MYSSEELPAILPEDAGKSRLRAVEIRPDCPQPGAAARL